MTAPDDAAAAATTTANALGSPGTIGSALAGGSGAKTEVADAPGANVKEGAMDLEAALLNGVADDGVGHEHGDAGLDVELGEAEGAPLVTLDIIAIIIIIIIVVLGGSREREGVDLLLVGGTQRLQGREPCVEDAANAGIREGGDGAAARRVPAQHDVLDLQVRDGVLDHGRRVDVGRRHDVGDVAVYEYVARL